MNYEGYTEFPFPTILKPEEEKLQEFFLKLPDEEQLKLLSGSRSYDMFCDRLKEHISYRN